MTAFICFCLISSSVYILNDILVLLLVISILIALNLNVNLELMLFLYFVNNLIYSFKIKNVVLLDIFSISRIRKKKELINLRDNAEKHRKIL